MSNLLYDQFEPCVMIDKTTVNDGYGGFKSVWAEGARFQAFCRVDTSMEARTAEAQGVTSLYTVITPENITLQYHDIFRRLSDGKLFRVTSDGDDFKVPSFSTIRAWAVTAEELTALPDDRGGGTS